MRQGSYDNINYDLLKFIPLDANLVLEIGCGSGELGRAYKHKNPFAHYMGIEGDDQAAVTANQYLDHVSRIDVEREELSAIVGKERKVDCLVYDRALEYLRDPWSILQKQIQYLTDGGQVVACIPNVQHWSLLINLLRGQWQYEDGGTVDNINLRFFTLESIQQMFAAAGLHVYEILPCNLGYKQEMMGKAQEILRQAAQAVGADLQHFNIKTGATHYVVRAVKQPIGKGMLLQSLLGETQVCSRVRISEPHSFCITTPGVRAVENVGTVNLDIGRTEERKVFIWQRVSPQTFVQQQQLIDRGYLSIYEIDDDPLRWKQSYEQNDFMAFRSCHAVQVSTQILAEYIRQFNPHVAVFPNQIASLPLRRTYSQKKSISLFFGALNREEEYKDIMPEINKILREYGKRVLVTVIHDQKFFEALQTVHKEFIPFCPYEKYQELLYKADIALLPLQNTRFNRMKSDLKFLECAANGVVALASPTVYRDTIQDGVTGLIYHNADEFAAKLHALLTDDGMRVGIANQAYEWVKNNRLLCQHYKERLVWYEGLHAQYDNLTKEIYRRMEKKSILSIK